MSYNIAYTKTMNGQEYAMPSKLFENGITFSIPEISITVPSWVEEIPHSIRNVDLRYKNSDIPDHLTLLPVISIPAFFFCHLPACMWNPLQLIQRILTSLR